MQFVIGSKIHYRHGLFVIVNSSDLISIKHSFWNNPIQSFEGVFEEGRLLNAVRADHDDQEQYPTRGAHFCPLNRVRLRILSCSRDYINHILAVFTPTIVRSSIQGR